MSEQVVYLSQQTYEKELQQDIDYDDLQSKKERFPQINFYVPNYSKIRMSQTGKYSVSKLEEATITTREILEFYNDFILSSNKSNKSNKIEITDATANAGGNTINFGLNNMKVNAIEYSFNEFERLKNNVEQYNLPNVVVFNDDSLKLIYTQKIKQDIVYFDPPWGGPSYKKYKFLGLSLDEKDITEHIEKMLDENYCSLVVLKGPYNTFIKKRKYLNLIIDVTVKQKKYYNLFFFSKVDKNKANSVLGDDEKIKTTETININPFFLDSKDKQFIKVERKLSFNRKWNIYNLSYVILQQPLQSSSTMSSTSENENEYTYDTTEHELSEKQFVYHNVNDYFFRNKIENVYYTQCRELAFFINKTAINEIIALFSLPNDIKMRQIVRQFCMLYMIDRIIPEKKNISFESPIITYNGFNAMVKGIEYDTKMFVDGMYILPEILPKITIDRYEHLSSFILTNKNGIMKFTMINDFDYGDLCPGIYKCLIENLMNYLTDKFIAFQQKTRVALVKTTRFDKSELSYNDIEEIILVFASDAVCKMKEYDSEKRFDLLCPKGTVLVLRRAAYLSHFEIVPQGGKETCVLLYY